MLTVGEHDDLWKAGAKSIPQIHEDLKTANIIACVKNLYDAGEVSLSDYRDTLVAILKQNGIDAKIK